MSASERLAQFVVESRWTDIPPDIRQRAVRSILNGFGTALGGSTDTATVRLLETLAQFSGPSTASVIGHSAMVSMPDAAFLNAVSTNVFDFDDTHDGTIIHPTAPIAPALFALAEDRRISGPDLLHAFVLGVEVACRLGSAVSPSHYKRGWHITSTCGVFGAAAAVGRIIGLDRQQMLWAFGNASAQACGMVETLGTMAKSVGVGNAARNGLLAALMAQNGVEGPAAPLEGERGFLRLTSDDSDPNVLTSRLRESWELSRNMWKPFPCAVVLNPVIDACLTARQDPRFEIAAIECITVTGHPLLRDRADRAHVTTGREAQVSAQHAVAVSLLRGSAGIADFSDAAVADPEVLALRARIEGVAVDVGIPVEAVELSIRLRDGSGIRLRIDTASGSLGNPLSDSELEAKFFSLAHYGLPGFEARPLIKALWRLEEAEDAGSIMALARVSAPL